MTDHRVNRLDQLTKLIVEEIRTKWRQKYLRKQLTVDLISTLALMLSDDGKPLELLEEAIWETANKFETLINKAKNKQERGD